MAHAHRKICRYFQIPDPLEPTGYRYYKIAGFLKGGEDQVWAYDAFDRVRDKRRKVVDGAEVEYIRSEVRHIDIELLDWVAPYRLLTCWEWNKSLPHCLTYLQHSNGMLYRHTAPNVELIKIGEEYLILLRYWL